MVSAEIVIRYFTETTPQQRLAIEKLYSVYENINAKINLISRKDFDNFYLHHVLHSLALLRFCKFAPGNSVIDIGTGGGFPGIPLAIMLPDVQFTLVDSIGKKIRAVDEVVEWLELSNVKTLNIRTENVHSKFDIATARAVAPASELWTWMQNKWKNKPCFYLLKGGDLSMELNELLQTTHGVKIEQFAISEVFPEPFFETKKVVQLLGR